VNELKSVIGSFQTYTKQLVDAVEAKRNRLFERIDLQMLLETVIRPDSNKGAEIVSSINAIIAEHNEKSSNFERATAAIRKSLAEAYVAEAVAEFQSKVAEVGAKQAAKDGLEEQISKIDREVKERERQMIEHHRPAEELTSELTSYLGRSEIKVQVAQRGYSLARDGVRATHLSEGERTAIAFLYYLKTLQDKDFQVQDGIVVIDDPVSSLDSNALFSAFGYMKERTRNANQLFILTHNFSFFRQVKNWFDHVNQRKSSKGTARFFMLERAFHEQHRSAEIVPLDDLLDKFQSEYHFLFKKVYEVANCASGQRQLDEYYSMPNIARRLLESFLGFRYPSALGRAYQQLEMSSFEEGKRIRLLRFLNTYSHDANVGEQEHDPSILAETPQIMRELLEFLKHEDAGHHAEMLKLLGVEQAQAAGTA
jgi:wobble nucleotide-excising tRNase